MKRLIFLALAFAVNILSAQKLPAPKLFGLHPGLFTGKFIALRKKGQPTLFRLGKAFRNWEKAHWKTIPSGQQLPLLTVHTFSGAKKPFIVFSKFPSFHLF